MNASKDKDEGTLRSSYKKETTELEHEENGQDAKDRRRSLANRPLDPNALTTDLNFPPGIEPEDAADPGRATPGAPPVDNRTGKKK